MNNFNVEIPFHLINNLIHDVELYVDNNEEIDELTKLNIKSDIQPIKELLEPITNPERIDLFAELFNKITEENNRDQKSEVSDWTDIFREDTPATRIREFIDRTNQIYDDSKLSIGFVADINSYLIYSDNEIVASINADRHVSFLCNKYNVELVYLLNLIDFSGEFL